MRIVPPRRLGQMYDLRTWLQPRFTGGRGWSGSGAGNVGRARCGVSACGWATQRLGRAILRDQRMILPTRRFDDG
jgi:hypothetical protein